MPKCIRHLLLVFTCVAVLCGAARGDVVRLKNGGEVRGRLISQDASSNEGPVEIATMTGGLVVIPRKAVEFVVPRPMKVEEYETLARAVPDTIEERWKLAEWCRQNQLKPQRAEQLEQILALDPEHEQSHRGLGHIQHDDQWMTRDAVMAAQGYVKHNGKYVTQQQLDLLLKTETERQAEQAWFPKVRLWFGWAAGRHPGRRQEGTASLSQITDPDAVPALTSVMAEHADDAVRVFYVKLLSGMPGPKPVPLLVARSLLDANYEVRHSARAGLKPDQHDEAVRFYLPELQHDDNAVIRRTAEALGMFADERVVPELIDALVTTHKYKVQVPANTAVSFGRTADGQVVMSNGGGQLPPDVEVMLRTGQLPFGVKIIDADPTPKRMKTVVYKADLQNQEVLAALQKITRQSFGYQKREWRLWWASHTSGLNALP